MTKPTIILVALLVLLGVAIGTVHAAEEVSEKLPIPSDEAQQEALKLVKDVYKEDFDNAKTAAKKADLAKKLLQEGIATKDSPDGKYVLLLEARSLALQVNSASTALAATDELAQGFSVNALKMQAEVLEKLSKPEPNAKEAPLVIESARRFVVIAIADDRVDIAESLLSSGMAAAKKSKNLTAAREFTLQLNYVRELKKELEQVSLALKSLDQDPTDAAANQVIGRYRCLQKGDWKLGLPMLALANDKAIKSIAEEELSVPATAAEQIELGDHWWALAEKETEPYRSRMQVRSGFWYEQGLPSLTGLAKARVEKQLKAVKQIKSEIFIPPQQARVLLDGPASVIYFADLKESAIDVLQYQGKAILGKGIINAEEKPIIGGRESPKGIFPHPKPNGRSTITYDLKGKRFRYFEAEVGVSEQRNIPGNPQKSYQFSPLTFEVWGDGKMLWRSAEVMPGSQPQKCKVPLPELSQLELIVHCRGHANYAWAIWAEPRLTHGVWLPSSVEPNSNKDTRSRWIITTYGRSIEDEDGGQWVEQDLKTKKLVVRYTQSSRTNHFVELFCPDHGTTTRLLTNTAQQPNKTGGGWGWVSFGYWETPESDAEFTRITSQPAPDVPPGDKRVQWFNESYDDVSYRTPDGFWNAKENKSGKVNARYAKEIARTADYVECIELTHRYRFRIGAKKSELFTDGEWKWGSNGHW